MKEGIDTLMVCGGGYVSGKEVVALTLAKGMAKAGRRVHVLATTWTDGNFIRRLEEAGLPYSRAPLGFISATLRWDCIYMSAAQMIKWPVMAWKYRALLASLRPRRVLHTNWHHTFLLWPFLRRTDVLWLHEVLPDLPHYRAVFSRMAERLGCIVAVSQPVARALMKHGIPEGKIFVIHNGIPDPHGGSPRGERRPTCIGIVGQIGDWKGHDDLIEAFHSLAAKYEWIELKIFGNDRSPYAQSLRSRITALGLQDRVTWCGFVQDQRKIYESIDVLAVPSRFEEPLSTTALEGGYCGIPVVATTCGGMPEIVDDQVTGYLVPPRAPAQLAVALERLITDPALCRRLGANARHKMQQAFSESRFVSDFVDRLDRLAK